jgi:hypothetical protein
VGHARPYSGSVADRKRISAGLLYGVIPPSWNTNLFDPISTSCGGKKTGAAALARTSGESARSRFRSGGVLRYRSARLYFARVQLLTGHGESVPVLWSTRSRSERSSGSPSVRSGP